ncbi:pentapeptide repeat-containing protein [Streptomyces sp. NBC_01563]|uniref:pentapeptide repeat-containing protein n=1 Tax=Streptomyces sp. NBC_01563 TaxID=2975880 RepID=UPI00386D551B
MVGLPWLIWRGPYVLDAKYIDRKALGEGSAALVTGLRTALVAVVAALGAGIALLYTARTYRLTRRGQITDRFTKALERLGSSEIYIRIGGILALEQIVQDAPEQAATDAAAVLGHFVRHRAPKARRQDDPDPGHLPEELEADVQAALTALTRAESRTHVDPRQQLDLSGLHLVGARLKAADLTYVDLRGADLTGAYLTGATLTEATLIRATLTKATLFEATLTEADLAYATLTGANLRRANLTKAYLVGATLTGAKLGKATLTGADLEKATLRKAALPEAMLTGADLNGADLSGAILTTADLSGAVTTGIVTDKRTKMPEGWAPEGVAVANGGHGQVAQE